jgi:hypothetical protein
LADEARACAEALPVEELCATQGVDLITGVSGLLLALHRAGATAQARAGLSVLLARREDEGLTSYPPGARILGALPDTRLARALCVSRLGGQVPPLPPIELTAGALLARLELAREPRERELIRSEVVRYLELPAEGDLSRLERLDVALEAALDDHAVRLGLDILQARRQSGRWFPDQWAADRHQLSALWGLPALAHAFLRLSLPGRFSSLRLVR